MTASLNYRNIIITMKEKIQFLPRMTVAIL